MEIWETSMVGGKILDSEVGPGTDPVLPEHISPPSSPSHGPAPIHPIPQMPKPRTLTLPSPTLPLSLLPSNSSNWPCQCGLQICSFCPVFNLATWQGSCQRASTQGSSTNLTQALLKVQESQFALPLALAREHLRPGNVPLPQF